MNTIQKTNLLKGIPRSLSQEWFQTLLETAHIKIERIVSKGHRSADGFWYDQDWDEWVLLLQGSAGLVVDGQAEAVQLAAGDALLIPRGVKHRVAWTDERRETIWLAVHMYANGGPVNPPT